MNKSIRAKRDELRKISVSLRECAFDCKNFELTNQIRKEQNEIYNKMVFYDNIIKTIEKK